MKYPISFLAVGLSLVCSSVYAHSGDHSFFEAFEHERQELLSGKTRGAAADFASTPTVVSLGRKAASRFGIVHDREGQTLLPHGTICDGLDVDTSGVVIVRFTLPKSFKASQLTELKLDTMNEVVRSYVGGLDIKSIRLLARKDGRSPYTSLADFQAPAPPAVPTNKDWIEPNGPGLSDTEERQTSDSGATVVDPRIGGQGPIGTSSAPSGAMSGKVVYFSAGHGWTWNGSSWYLQRPVDLEGMNEDFGNVDQIEFLAQYLFNAGATVVPMRPIGHQPNAVIVDNPEATFTGPWSDSSSSRYFGSGVPYRFATKSATETAAATFTPDIPEAGFYPIYVWALYGSDRVDNQLYKINHTGGTSEVRINHRRVGAGWIWVGTYYLEAGANPATGSVVVSNQSNTATGNVVIADAVRFGNGIGPSGNLRENEAAKYWIRDGHGVGGPSDQWTSSTVYAYSGAGWPRAGSTDSGNTVNSPARNSAHMHRDDGQGFTSQVFVGWHSNAFNTIARGSVALYNDDETPANSIQFATRLSDGVDNDAYIEDDKWEYTWAVRGPTLGANYGEISNEHLVNTMTGSIIEVAFHDNPQDAALMRDPKVRNVVARGVARGIQRYFVSPTGTGNVSTTLLPEPPVNFRVVNNGTGGATITWSPPPTGGANGNAATGYRVYQSSNGYGYGLVATSNTPSATVSGLTAGETYYFRIAATNAGGESMPTESLALRITASGNATTLVINGYDRLDRFNNILEPGFASTERIRLRRNNSYDYLIEHGEALHANSRDFDSTSNEAVALGLVSLSNYQTVIWLLGEEDTKNQTLDSSERSRLGTFLNSGGHLFITGSEIGAHLNDSVSGDPAFYNNMLKASLDADNAGSYLVAGVGGTALDGLTMNFTPDTDMYNVDKPDRLLAVNGSVVAAHYTGTGSGAAAIQFKGPYRLVYFGFPFEAINSATTREQVMGAVLTFFDTPNSSVEDWSIF